MATINFNNQVYAAGFFGTDDGTPNASFQIDDTYNFPVTVNGTVSKAGDTVTLSYTLPGSTTRSTQTLTATNFDNATQIEFSGTGLPGSGPTDTSTNRYVFSNSQLFGSGNPNRTRFTADTNGVAGDYVVCFAAGTLILAVRDGIVAEIAVEDLRAGDLAVTASGAHRPIRWIGTRAYSGRFANRNPALLPIRFAAGSLGNGLPRRDLLVSPKHAMVLDGMLVPAEALVNGGSITKVARVESLAYYHVELDSHDVLLAEGAPSESYVADNNRAFFHNAADLGGHEDREALYCLPRIEQGHALEALRQKLGALDDVAAARAA